MSTTAENPTTQPEKDASKLRDRVAKLEADVSKIAKSLKRISDEIYSEWGEETVPEGETIAGIKF